MNLFLQATYARSVRADHYKQILRIKSNPLILVDDFYVCEVLTIRADLILAFHNEYATLPKDAMRLSGGAVIQLQNCRVPLCTLAILIAIGVMFSECLVGTRSGLLMVLFAEESLHVGRIQNDTVDALRRIWQVPTVYPIRYIRAFDHVFIFRHASPEDAFPICDIRNRRALRNM